MPNDPDEWIDTEPFRKELQSYHWNRPEDLGEVRLVAWAPTLARGQSIVPKVDRHRGLTLVIAHLKLGPPPDPAGAIYDALAVIPEEADGP